MEYDKDGFGENGYTREWNTYMPILKGLVLSLIVIGLLFVSGCSSLNSFETCYDICIDVDGRCDYNKVTKGVIVCNETIKSEVRHYCYDDCK